MEVGVISESWLSHPKVIGNGGFGEVYKYTLTKSSDNQTTVAVKKLRDKGNG